MQMLGLGGAGGEGAAGAGLEGPASQASQGTKGFNILDLLMGQGKNDERKKAPGMNQESSQYGANDMFQWLK